MNAENTVDTPHVYDRAILLSPEKRNQVMTSWEVERYGLDSYADAEYVHLYGIQVHERVEPDSLVEPQRRFEWSAVHIYPIKTEGMRHGVLLGRCHWQA